MNLGAAAGAERWSGAERTPAAARGLRVRVVEDEPFADQARVVVEHGAVQIQQALLVDVQLRAFRSLEHFVAEARLLLPREGVAEARATAALYSHAQTSVVDALLGHQGPDLPRRGFADFDAHRSGLG